jgi:type II secretory pathway pseudopilin PulG
MSGFEQNQYDEQGYMQAPAAPPPRSQGLPVWAKWLIGCSIGCVLLFILAVVGSIAIPLLLGSRENAVNEKARNSLRTVISAEAAYFAQHQRYGGVQELVQGGYLDNRFSSADGLGNGIVLTILVEDDGMGYDAIAASPGATYTCDENGEIAEQE